MINPNQESMSTSNKMNKSNANGSQKLKPISFNLPRVCYDTLHHLKDTEIYPSLSEEVRTALSHYIADDRALLTELKLILPPSKNVTSLENNNNEYVPMTASIPEPLFNAMNDLVKKERFYDSRSALIRNAIRKFLLREQKRTKQNEQHTLEVGHDLKSSDPETIVKIPVEVQDPITNEPVIVLFPHRIIRKLT